MKRLFIAIALALVMLLAFSMPIVAATTAIVTVTYTPQYVAISIAPTTWTINGIAGNSKIQTSTTYYSNPLGDNTAPTGGGAGVDDTECQFTITNTSNVAIDIKVTSADASGGTDAMTNSNGGFGSPGATAYGATSYFTGQLTAAWVTSKSSGTAVAKAALAATTNIKTGMIIATQTGAWSVTTPKTSSTILITWSAAAS